MVRQSIVSRSRQVSRLAAEPLPELRSRKEIVAGLKAQTVADVLVVGGGPVAAATARLCALNGLSTVLLASDDYGHVEGFSPWELLVRPGITGVGIWRFLFGKDFGWWRYWQHTAGHLMKWVELIAGQDELVSRAGWVKRLARCVGAPRRSGLWLPILDWERVSWELVLAARQEGAQCLNYAEIVSIGTTAHGPRLVVWRDGLSGERQQLKVGAILNCDGVQAPMIGRVHPGESAKCLQVQVGQQLVFEHTGKDWSDLNPVNLRLARWSDDDWIMAYTNGPQLVIETFSESQPWSSSGLGGIQNSDVKLHQVILEVMPDLNLAGYVQNRARVVQATVPGSGTPLWQMAGGMMVCCTSAGSCAEEVALAGLRLLARQAQKTIAVEPVGERKLPGWALYGDSVAYFYHWAAEHDVPIGQVERAIQALGALVRFLPAYQQGIETLGTACCLRGESDIAERLLQAVSDEGVVARLKLVTTEQSISMP